MNFLYVLYLYARNRTNEKSQWKRHVRDIFRKEIREVIQNEYNIYAMRARLGVDGELYLQQHFYELNGRVFQPYGEERTMYFAYARPANKLEETQRQYTELEKYFIIQPCSMGQDPQNVLKADMEQELEQPIITPQWLTIHYLERDMTKGILVGYYKKEQLQWILGNNFYKRRNIQFVILYTDDVENTGEYRVFHVKDTAGKVPEERMRNTWYPTSVKGNYFFFRFDEEVNIGRLDMVRLLNDLRENHKQEFGSYTSGEPMFSTAEDLLKYRHGF